MFGKVLQKNLHMPQREKLNSKNGEISPLALLPTSLNFYKLSQISSIFNTLCLPFYPLLPYYPLLHFAQNAQPLLLLTGEFNVVATHSKKSVIKRYIPLSPFGQNAQPLRICSVGGESRRILFLKNVGKIYQE